MRRTNQFKPYLTVREIAEEQAICEKTVRKLLDDGTLPGGYKVGRSRRVVRQVYENWIDTGGGEGPKDRQSGGTNAN